jgi:DDB1- and CUL4-associated factor 7
VQLLHEICRLKPSLPQSIMNRDILDYESPCQTYPLSFSPLSSQSTSSSQTPNLRLAIGSYLQAGQGDNHITVVGLDPMVLYQQSLEDSSSTSPNAPPLRNASSSSFVPLARANHIYPVTALEFAPVTLASSDNGIKRELIGSTSDCLRLWDFVEDEGGNNVMSGGGGYVGRMGSGAISYRLTQRSQLSHVRRKLP